MSTHFHNPFLALFGGLIALFLSCCVAPRPQSFVDADNLPSDYVGRRHRVLAKADRLIVEVIQITGFNVVGFDALEQDGNLYIYPRHISSGGSGTGHFEIDVSKFRLGADWPEHTFWLLQEFAYPPFRSSERKTIWLRKKVDIVKE